MVARINIQKVLARVGHSTKRLLAFCGELLPIVIGATIMVVIMRAFSYVYTLHEAMVVDKLFQAAYTETIMMNTDDGNDVLYPQTFFAPSKWSVKVAGSTPRGDPRIELWEVNAGFYSEVAIGDRVYRGTESDAVSIDRKVVAEDAAHGD